MSLSLRADVSGTSGALQLNGVDKLLFNADGTLSGDTSPAQFDASEKLATMEAVQRALGNFSGTASYAVNTVIPASDAGKRIIIAAGAVVTLPLLSSVPVGARFYFRISGTATVQRQGTDTISAFNSGGLTSIPFTASGFGCFVASATSWGYEEGDAVLAYSPQFGVSLAASGYQKLPSGMIMQWGTISFSAGVASVTFPIAFPNQVFVVVPGDASAAGNLAYIGADAPTLSGFTARSSNASDTGAARYIAIGY